MAHICRRWGLLAGYAGRLGNSDRHQYLIGLRNIKMLYIYVALFRDSYFDNNSARSFHRIDETWNRPVFLMKKKEQPNKPYINGCSACIGGGKPAKRFIRERDREKWGNSDWNLSSKSHHHVRPPSLHQPLSFSFFFPSILNGVNLLDWLLLLNLPFSNLRRGLFETERRIREGRREETT